MKSSRILLLVFLVLLLTQTDFSQRRLDGKAVEVIDGKTIVIETPTFNRVTVILQFIEIPEAEQPLHQTVKEHLQKMVLDKTVEFLPRILTQKTAIGQVFLDNVDLSQQLLRDGAAWYSLPEKNSQNSRERELYQLNEGQAKLEKRGIWSIENLKPAWEFRAEREEIKRQEERARLDAAMSQNTPAQTGTTVRKPTQQRPTGTGFGLDMWTNVNETAELNKNLINGGLITGAVQNYGFGYVATSRSSLNLANGTARKKFETRTIYVYPLEQRNGESVYVIGFLVESEKSVFADSNLLSVNADGQKISLGKAYRFQRQLPYSVQELLLYQTKANVLTKIVNAQNLQITLGKFSGNIGSDYQSLIKNLLTVTK